MIKINLALKKQISPDSNHNGSSSGSSSRGFDREQIVQLARAIIVPIIVGYLGNYALEDYKETELKQLNAELEKASAEGEKIVKAMNGAQSGSGSQEALSADAALVQSKLEAMKGLLNQKSESFKILALISSSIPSNVWITEVKAQSQKVLIKGGALEMRSVSDFMKALNGGGMFASIDLSDNRQVNSEGSGKTIVGSELSNFELTIQRR